jgi:hypothetical protein
MTDQQLTAPQITEHSDPSDTIIRDALDVIDGALAHMMRRELVSSGEVADLLLDVRSLLTAPAHPS